MEARIKHAIVCIMVMAIFASVCIGQQPAVPFEPPITADFNTPSVVPAFPYIASVMGTNVQVRSGPGTNFYPCGKLNKGDTVTIVDNTDTGWSRIIPPAEAFSWVSMRYVEIDPNAPGVGLINGNAIKVYVGSPLMDPIHSMQSQLTLNKGEVVTLLGESKSDYHKILPPAGAYRWISTRYTKPMASVVPRVPPGVIAEIIDSNSGVVVPADVPIIVPGVAADSNVGMKLHEYYKLQKVLEAERAKPVDEQNYADLRKSFEKLAADKEAGKAARYSKFTLQQIDRFELALEIARVVKQQNTLLQEGQARITEAVNARLAEFQRMGRYAAIGKLRVFTLYGPGHYRIVDDSGTTICHALPVAATANADLSRLVGKKVGLVGTIEADRETAGALVRFTEIVELK